MKIINLPCKSSSHMHSNAQIVTSLPHWAYLSPSSQQRNLYSSIATTSILTAPTTAHSLQNHSFL